MTAQAAKKTEQNLSYEEVPYESYFYPQTSPSHINTVATLFGLTPPDFRTARVLELGCAGGGNLFPQAMAYPKASFLGIDFSEAQIAEATRQKQALKLDNIEFQQQDILNFDLKTHKGKFDYIICHGVFSWVPEDVREKILGLCNECLSPQGIAIISYNTLPGWNAVRSLREMMLFHTARFTNPAEKIQQARLLLDFLAENTEDKRGYRSVIEEERKLLQNASNTYLYHDHLERVNTQFYFHDFVRMAGSHGLAYVGDVAFASMYLGNLTPKVMATLKTINDVVTQEQYMDFINNRRFRSSIICKDGGKINRNLQNSQILNYFLSPNQELTASGQDPQQSITFKTPNGAQFATHNVMTGTLYLELLAVGQKPVAVNDLVARVQKKLGLNDAGPVRDTLVEHGLQLALQGFINLHSDTAHCVTEVSQKPVSFPIARYQAGAMDSFIVTNAVGNTITLDITSKLVLQNLDGSRTVQDLVNILIDNIRKGVLKIEKNGGSITDADELRIDVAHVTGEVLQKLSRLALLVG